jgi:hypothetical protein
MYITYSLLFYYLGTNRPYSTRRTFYSFFPSPSATTTSHQPQLQTYQLTRASNLLFQFQLRVDLRKTCLPRERMRSLLFNPNQCNGRVENSVLSHWARGWGSVRGSLETQSFRIGWGAGERGSDWRKRLESTWIRENGGSGWEVVER